MTLKVSTLVQNNGQLGWLPKNPRQWTQTDIDRTAASIREDEDFLEDRPLLVVPKDAKTWVVFAGNLRLTAAKKIGLKEVPCIAYARETDEDDTTIKRRAMKDNGSFGAFDYDLLANEWDDLPLADFGVPVWDTSSDMKLTTEGRQGGEGYDEFVDKFNEEQPLTTDDCYTPPEVYEVVRDFVNEKVAPLAGRKIIRPFFPGGDYEDLTQYPKGCVVLDNPPFSIYSKIVRFYLEHGIDFFLFGPNLTLLVQGAEVCYCIFNVPVVYENGAKVSTGFVTNLRKGLRIWVDHELRERVQEAQKKEPTTPVYEYPAEFVSSAVLGKIANGGDLQIRADECVYIRDLDGFKEIGKGLFGGGFLISRAAAEKARAAAEKARAAAEKARAVKIELSPRERAIVDELDKLPTPGDKVS